MTLMVMATATVAIVVVVGVGREHNAKDWATSTRTEQNVSELDPSYVRREILNARIAVRILRAETQPLQCLFQALAASRTESELAHEELL